MEPRTSWWKFRSGIRITRRKPSIRISRCFARGTSAATCARRTKICIQEPGGMPNTFDWDNAEEIGIQLAEQHPGVDPLTVRFTDLHKWIVELPGFTGDPKLSNEGKLEAIQMAWHEEFQDNQG